MFALTRVRFNLPSRTSVAVDFRKFCLVASQEAS